MLQAVQTSSLCLSQPVISNLYIIYINNCITKNGGWVLETSRSFHYWQQAPRWRLLPWLANPGNPAISPHAVRGTGTCHTAEKVERGRERGWEGNCLGDELPHYKTPENASCTYAMLRYATLQYTSVWNSDTCAYNVCANTADLQELFVVNSVKLHLTA